MVRRHHQSSFFLQVLFSNGFRHDVRMCGGLRLRPMVRHYRQGLPTTKLVVRSLSVGVLPIFFRVRAISPTTRPRFFLLEGHSVSHVRLLRRQGQGLRLLQRGTTFFRLVLRNTCHPFWGPLSPLRSVNISHTIGRRHIVVHRHVHIRHVIRRPLTLFLDGVGPVFTSLL